MNAEETSRKRRQKGPVPLKKRMLKITVITLIAVAAGLAVVFIASQAFLRQEDKIRDAWRVDVGDLLGRDEELQVDLWEAPLEASLSVLQITPAEVSEEGFTYYDEDVQARLEQTVERLKARTSGWSADAPLAILNPYGTGTNGLYLYFSTQRETSVSYTIHVEDPDIPDFTAEAADVSGSSRGKTHEFQLIGLVPGQVNHVTLNVLGSRGGVRQSVAFTIEAPGTVSGYPVQLETEDGGSTAPLSGGLYAMMRTNGYLGYGFFFDNSGVLRYELLLEGFGMDRILETDGDILCCVSTTKLARINGLGQVERVYPLDGYELHHDIVFGPEGTVAALVSHASSDRVEDVVVEVDLESGAVTELADFTDLMPGYFDVISRPTAVTDDFFWLAGTHDWIHLNTLQYLEEQDSIIVSSRETSTIIKVEGIHTSPTLAWFAGDSRFWAGTPYEGLCLTQVGDFTPQYGQHSVEYAGPGPEEGTYYLRMYNNNYWSLNSRDGYAPDLEEGVGTGLYGSDGDLSYVYTYLVDENERTFSLEDSFPVPYSSIVSNAAPVGTGGNWIVNSGMSNVFGEYDAEGGLIRQFAYTCTMQGYRTFKPALEGFWFAAGQ